MEIRMPLPNLIVIGAMKCGTTSLHYYLGRHPEIAMSRDKELNFFVAERNWAKGVDWYASRFPEDARIRGESSPSYTAAARFSGVPARMHAIVPDARLVYMVRDPVERLISNWVHAVAIGKEDRRLAEAAQDAGYLDRSSYWRQISVYLEHYPRERILLIAMEELAENRAATLRQVYEFLEVDPDVPMPPDLRLHRSDRKRLKTPAGAWIARSWVGRGVQALPQWVQWRAMEFLYRPFSRKIERPALSERERALLIERLREDTNRFRELAGRDFPTWSV
jgi:hypothetical protein